MTEEYYKSWNIKGIAESVIKEIKEDGEDLDDVLDDYLQRTYWSIYSREPEDARIVVELVKKFIGELEKQS
ncbi:MAG: hypothetical protein M1461_01380 [Nitrospirae bacterium]|nr:hypothetical protein [Nitrospirota bacterium]